MERARFYSVNPSQHEMVMELISLLPLKVGDGISPIFFGEGYLEYEVTRVLKTIEVESLFRSIPEGEYWEGGRK